MNEQVDATLRIKAQLKTTWPVFFARFGRLLPIQIQVIPLVLDERNAIISSPTASGKTEAVMAPLSEMLLRSHAEGLSLLYISPTRALVNDLYERLSDPLSEIGLSVAVKTGDRPQFDPEDPQNILLTTPEALDSLICRSPDVFNATRFVILDELHLIDKSYRGDQLRILLRRLDGLSETDRRYYALSATLSSPRDIADRYFADSVVATVPGSREIEWQLFGSIEDAIKAARGERMHKVLVFCNRRREVEEVSHECQSRGLWPGDRLAVHHGKLDKGIREGTERFMRECKWGLCIATMTLEIGIDIGDIDVVMLYGPPWSVSALLQRVGRGNRRKGKAVAFGIYRNPEEEEDFKQLFALAEQGDIEDSPYRPDLSVVVQQILSCLYQHRDGLGDEFFRSLFNDFCSRDDLLRILQHLGEQEMAFQNRGKWYASAEVMDMGDGGSIHSNIASTTDYRVVDGSTGTVLGEVSGVLVENAFRIGGKSWKVVEVNGRVVTVVPSIGGQAAPFSASTSKGSFAYLLPPDLKRRGGR